MNRPQIDKIVQAVLYEGYNLYPYRPSVKNRHRWTFGTLFPRSYCDVHGGAEPWTMQTQCLVHGDEQTMLSLAIGFLQLRWRRIGQLLTIRQLSNDHPMPYELVDSLQIGEKLYQTWQEAIERQVPIDAVRLGDLIDRPKHLPFSFPDQHEFEPIQEPGQPAAAVILRDQEPIEGDIELSAERLENGLMKVTVRICNRSAFEAWDETSRDEALMRSFASTHCRLNIEAGEFVSLMDPPEQWRSAATGCQNIGVWPVLVGNPGEKDAMLAAPIILYDYPEIARESPGDLFDGTEIDEILTLRIMTLTENERRAAEAVDERTRLLLQRTELLAREQLAGLHGVVRSVQPVAVERVGWVERSKPQQSTDDRWNPFAEVPTIEEVVVEGVTLRRGDRVRLRPRPGADILDLALGNKLATIESIEQDYEDNIHLAVTLDDDPGRDFGRQRQIGHRFFFKPEEIEPVEYHSSMP